MEWVEDLEKIFVQRTLEGVIAWDEIDDLIYEESWDNASQTTENSNV